LVAFPAVILLAPDLSLLLDFCERLLFGLAESI